MGSSAAMVYFLASRPRRHARHGAQLSTVEMAPQAQPIAMGAMGHHASLAFAYLQSLGEMRDKGGGE